MLEISHLTLRSAERAIVDDLSLSLPASGLTALIGPSGCGKSSVLKWIAGITAPGIVASGRLAIGGQPVPRPASGIGYQPQSDALFPWLTIAQNAALGPELAGLPRRAAQARIAPLFARFGLAGCESRYPAELSGGMRQRAAFLRTVAAGSRFLLLDEPFSALDAVTRLRMQDWLAERLAEGIDGSDCSVLLVTHDLTEAAALADRILVMAAKGGKILADLAVPIPRHQRSEARMAELRETLKSLLIKEEPT